MIAPNRSDPLAMFIAWLVRIFDQITRMKRIRHTTRFKANWRDHWQNLRQLEWLRDQILAGETLDAESDFIPSTDPPADYGGPCPRTPFDMNRRFLAIARFNADPASAILEHVRRIAKRESIDLSNPLAAHGSTDTALCAAAHHELVGVAILTRATSPFALILSSTRSVRTSKDERGPAHARGPPLNLSFRKIQTVDLAGITCEIASSCPQRAYLHWNWSGLLPSPVPP